jgi:gas vesicle protein
MSDKGGGSGFLFGAVIGGLVGAAAGMLLAPRPGKEMRGQLADQAELVRSRRLNAFDDQISELRQNLTEVRDIVREAMAEGREILKEAMDEGKRASARAQDELKEQYRERVRPDKTDDK